MSVKKKKVTVTFFITGQEDKSVEISTPKIFETIWKSSQKALAANDSFPEEADSSDEQKTHEGASPFPKVTPLVPPTVMLTEPDKSLVLAIHEHDQQANLYYGFVGVFRDTTLPTIYNKETATDKNIPLQETDEILEKSYFLYYEDIDLLVFHQNHLGPRADDLAYMLFKHSGMQKIIFDPIWKKNSVKEILETGSIMKHGALTLALPRDFKAADLDLSNVWAEDIIKMMSKHGMSRMNINFWGRGSTRKSEVGYLVEDIKDGVKELLSKFATGSQRKKGQPRISKAVATVTGGEKQTLLDQELKCKVNVTVVNGYPDKSSMRGALIQSKLNTLEQLSPYIDKKSKVSA
ncbi:TPA: hypothetical protein P0E15_004350 [Vibrio harveyi]|nr:hypothetical protein [Vibrio harveyi]